MSENCLPHCQRSLRIFLRRKRIYILKKALQFFGLIFRRAPATFLLHLNIPKIRYPVKLMAINSKHKNFNKSQEASATSKREVLKDCKKLHKVKSGIFWLDKEEFRGFSMFSWGTVEKVVRSFLVRAVTLSVFI